MIWSDKGTKFDDVEKQLRKNIGKRNTNNSAAEIAHKGISWKFILSSAPYQCVILEKFVGIFKRAFYTTF